jgi:hypothetical protein
MLNVKRINKISNQKVYEMVDLIVFGSRQRECSSKMSTCTLANKLTTTKRQLANEMQRVAISGPPDNSYNEWREFV